MANQDVSESLQTSTSTSTKVSESAQSAETAKLTDKTSGFTATLFGRLRAATARFNRGMDWITGHWGKFTLNQKIYVFAVLFLFANFDAVTGDLGEDFVIVAGVAFIAMIRELWALFNRIWDTTLGKSVVLVVYAVIANLTLALAGQKINSIVGVAPSKLIYTQGLTTFIMLPFWILIISVIALSFIFIGTQVKDVLISIVRRLRLHDFGPRQKEHLAGWFVVIRLMLLPMVIIMLALLLESYTKNVGIINFSLSLGGEKISLQKEQVSDEVTTAIAKQADPDQDLGLKLAKVDKFNRVDYVIAAFVYNYETFELSRCKLAKGERAVPINESDILVAKKDASQPLGFKFSARLCELKSEDAEVTTSD